MARAFWERLFCFSSYEWITLNEVLDRMKLNEFDNVMDSSWERNTDFLGWKIELEGLWDSIHFLALFWSFVPPHLKWLVPLSIIQLTWMAICSTILSS